MSYEDAERMARAGDTLRALEAFQALAAANPDDFDSLVWLGRLLTRVGRRAEAIDLLRDVIARSPRQVDARVALGAALLTSGRVEDAYAVVQDAEALEPNSADVLALKGRILRHLGRPSDAYVALDAAHALSPRDEDISIVRERTRRMIAHRAHVSVAQEASEEIPEATIVDADVDLHLDDTVRVFGRVQWQARAGFDDARGGGGVEWRLSRRVVGRGALLISPGSPRLARADVGGEVEFAAGRTQTTFGLRYLDFAGARVWIIAPAISVDVNDNVALAVRYYRSESEFLPFGRRAGNDSGAILGRWQAARRLSLGGRVCARQRELRHRLGRSARAVPRRHGGRRRAHRPALADVVRGRRRAPVAQRRPPADAGHGRPRPAFLSGAGGCSCCRTCFATT